MGILIMGNKQAAINAAQVCEKDYGSLFVVIGSFNSFILKPLAALRAEEMCKVVGL